MPVDWRENNGEPDDAANSSGTNLGPTSYKLVNGIKDDPATKDVDEIYLGFRDVPKTDLVQTLRSPQMPQHGLQAGWIPTSVLRTRRFRFHALRKLAIWAQTRCWASYKSIRADARLVCLGNQPSTFFC